MDSYCGDNKNLSFLCLDLSLDRTGWSVFIQGNLFEYGAINCNTSNLRHVERLLCIIEEVREVLGKYKLDCVIIEDVHYSKNVDTFKRLCELRGLIMALSYEYVGNDIFIFPTAHPRSCFKLKGLPKVKDKKDILIKSKEDAFVYVQSLYQSENFNFKDHNDICDSIILGLSFMVQDININTKKFQSLQKKFKDVDIGKRILEQHWDNNVSIKDLAKEFKVTTSVLLSLFNCFKLPTRS